eukprot:428455-Rhodomonas_salina.2
MTQLLQVFLSARQCFKIWRLCSGRVCNKLGRTLTSSHSSSQSTHFNASASACNGKQRKATESNGKKGWVGGECQEGKRKR